MKIFLRYYLLDKCVPLHVYFFSKTDTKKIPFLLGTFWLFLCQASFSPELKVLNLDYDINCYICYNLQERKKRKIFIVQLLNDIFYKSYAEISDFYFKKFC